MQALHRELIELANQRDTPAVLRDDATVLLDTVGRFLPEPEQQDLGGAVASVPNEGQLQSARGSWMSGEVPVATGGGKGGDSGENGPVPNPPVPAPPGSPAPRLNVQVSPQADGTIAVTPRADGQDDAARTVRELLNGLVGRKLTPLGDVALDLCLHVERRDLELQRFLGAVYAGKPLLEAGVDFTTPHGAAVAEWFNTLARWRV